MEIVTWFEESNVELKPSIFKRECDGDCWDWVFDCSIPMKKFDKEVSGKIKSTFDEPKGLFNLLLCKIVPEFLESSEFELRFHCREGSANIALEFTCGGLLTNGDMFACCGDIE